MTDWRGLRIFYAAGYGMYGVILPYMPMILRDLGLKDSELTVALSAFGAASIVAPMFFAHFADKKTPFRRLAFYLLVVALVLAPTWSFAKTTLSAFIINFINFSLLFSVLSLLDSFTISRLKEGSVAGRSVTSFPSIRIWGSIGFIVPTLVLLLISHYSHINPQTHITLIVFTILIALVATRWLPDAPRPAIISTIPSVEAIRKAKSPELRGFFISGIMSGLAISVFYIVYPRYLQHLGCSQIEAGLITNLGVLLEICIMPFTTRAIKWVGIERFISFGHLCIGVRMLILALWPNLTVAILTQVLHGPMVIGLFVSSPMYIQHHSDERTRFSLQGLYSSLVVGWGRLIGPLTAGFFLSFAEDDSVSAMLMVFLVSGLLGFAAFGWFVVGHMGRRGRCVP